MELTRENYYTPEASQEYFSVSQFKHFMECPAAAMAYIDGSFRDEPTQALLEGSYVDAALTGDLSEFQRKYPETRNVRTGELKAPFRKAEKAVERAKRDPVFMNYLDGAKQIIVTGELFGQKWKGMIDVLHDDMIVDLKYMRNIEPVYKDGQKVTFIQGYGYDIQAYVYKELVKQNFDKNLPFYFAVITKEEPADIHLIAMDDRFLSPVKGLLEHYTPIFAAYKVGGDPPRCGHCKYCRETHMISNPMSYVELMEGMI